MMLSQNGYSAGDRSMIATYTIPGTLQRIPLRRGDTATALLYVAGRFHREVEPIRVGWCWGYAVRNIRGSATAVSNHASGTAVDLNAPAHPLGVATARTFTSAKAAAVQKILRECDGVIRWGGNYQGRQDAMHFEVVGSPGQVAALAARIRAPRPAAPRPPAWYHRTLQIGSNGPDVAAMQRRFNAYGGKLVADGVFGPKTAAIVQRTQHNHRLTADGVVGPNTAAVIG